MALVKSICLQNYPFNATKEQITGELVRIWPEVFAEPFRRGNLKVTVFKTKGNVVRATVSGFRGDFDEIKTKCEDEQLLGRTIVIKKDRDETRDEFGQFLTKKGVTQRRQIYQLEGWSQMKILDFFSKQFLDSLNVQMFDPQSRNIYFTPDQISESLMNMPGKIEFLGPVQSGPVLRAKYYTPLAAIQALCYLNQNENVSKVPLQFTNKVGTEKCYMQYKRGLASPDSQYGLEGGLLPLSLIAKENEGYIPFERFSKDMLDLEAINSAFNAYCWKCSQKYTLLGVSPTLNYLTGRCSCDYHTKNSSASAFHWPGETVTRLTAEKMDTNADTSKSIIVLSVNHRPMIEDYGTPKEYAGRLFPLLETEWKVVADEYRKSSKIEGTLKTYQFIEETEIKRKPRLVFALDVIVKRNKIWCIKNKGGLKDLTINIQMQSTKRLNRPYMDRVKAKLWTMKELPNEELLLEIQLYCQLDTKPAGNPDGNVEISAKPDKNEYERTRHFINEWCTKDNIDHPLLQFVLEPDKLKNVIIPAGKIQDHPNKNLYSDICEKLLKSLNEEQAMALKRAIRSTINFIQGPPGTGKTYLSAIILLILSLTEHGKIIICTSSNCAAARAAQSVSKLISQFKLPVKLLRVMAKSKENDKEDVNADSQAISYLHHLIRLSPDFLNNPELVEISNKIQRDGMYKLKKEERMNYENEICAIETSILSESDIIVCTLATLVDGRLECLKDRCPINTVLIDEAGQMTQPASLLITILNPSRIIFAGDHLQLQHTIKSSSAKAGGLNISQLEWVSISNIGDRSNDYFDHPSYTMLTVQYRMAPKIRQVVSACTYDNKLRDGDSIITRNSQLPASILDAIPEFKKSPILVKNIISSEALVGNSYQNILEAESIVILVSKLLKHKVDTTKIAILTLYEAQKQLIIKLLRDEQEQSNLPTNEVEVVNVDGYQGRENVIVIVSLVRTNTDIGFVKNPNRLNVALSRAKELLIIVCHFAVFENFLCHNVQEFCKNIRKAAEFI